MKKHEDMGKFMDRLELILSAIYIEYRTFDYDSPILIWMNHIQRKHIVRVSTHLPKGKYTQLFTSMKSKSVPALVQSSQWEYIESFSYTNFILHMIDPILFHIDTIGEPQGHDTHLILVPSELIAFYKSRGILNAKWLKN